MLFLKKLSELNENILERVKSQSAGLQWLYEMELVTNPQVLNNLELNIFYQSSYIKNVELLLDQNNKGILIYLELSTWGKWFKKQEIKEKVEDLMTMLLPNYRKRVIYELSIFQMALNKAKEITQGVEHEEPSNSSNNVSDSPSSV